MLKRILLLGVGIVLVVLADTASAAGNYEWTGDITAGGDPILRNKKIADYERSEAAKKGEAAKEAGQREGAEADAKMREQVKARKRGQSKQAHKANQDYMEKVRTGQVAKSAELGNPNYCVSQAVKQARRRVFTASELKHYAKGYEYRNEPFFVEERDGAMMLVDPHISQNIR